MLSRAKKPICRAPWCQARYTWGTETRRSVFQFAGFGKVTFGSHGEQLLRLIHDDTSVPCKVQSAAVM